ncbi:hypothetical protein GCM10023192_52270 [Amycolatopsis samaneae]
MPHEHSLYRPRHSRRQRTALTCAVIFFLAPAMAFVFGVRSDAFENRPLHQFPSLADGWGFFTGLSDWATDHLPLRHAGIQASDGISTGVFGDAPGTDHKAPTGPIGVDPQSTGGTGNPGGVAPGDVPGYVYPQVLPGKDGWLYLGEDVNAKCRPVLDMNHVVDALRRLRTAVESSGRRFQLVIAPDKSTTEPSHLPDSYVGKQCAAAKGAEFWNRVPRETGAIDLRPALATAGQQLGRAVYDPNDTHWGFGGGLTMTYALAQAITPGITTTWQVTPDGTRDWPADLERMLGRTDQRHLTSYQLGPDGGADRTKYLASDFRTTLRLTQPDTVPGMLTPKVGIVADSFTQFATPFLAATCRDVSITHTDTISQGSQEDLAELFSDRDVVTFEFVERSVVGGSTAVLSNPVLDKIAKALAQHPK